MRDAFCSSCGDRFALSPGVYPRPCGSCGVTTFRNPIPVAIAIVPVPGGLLTVQRAIEPHAGEFALPGGFVDFGESWRRACAREVLEETGVTIDADAITHFATHSTPDGAKVLIFGLCPPLVRMPVLRPNPETLSLGVYPGFDLPADLAFPIHTLTARACLCLP